MEYRIMRARAKINLALDVLGRRGDGYHDLRMIMQSVRLHDRILIKKVDKYPLKLITNIPWLPVDDRNLVYRAASFCQREFKLDGGLFIELKKSIPVSAGLAGGSSDCAATLVGINQLFRLNIPRDELMSIGKNFGADVPYCLMGGTALAEGIGEKLTPLTPHPPVVVVIAKPPVGLSTAQVFKHYQPERVQMRPDIPRMIAALEKGCLSEIASSSCNVLESVSERKHPDIARLKQIMLESRALGALMSGSGPTVFGYFASRQEGYQAIRRIKHQLPHVHEIFLTSTDSKGEGLHGQVT